MFSTNRKVQVDNDQEKAQSERESLSKNRGADYIFLSVLEISEDILRNQKTIIGLDSFSNQRLIYLALFFLL